MKKVYFLIVIAFIAGVVMSNSMKPKAAVAKDESVLPEYTIANCVSQFSKDKAVTTDKGFYYWFVDKKFTGNLNVKMSEVGANSANHPPHVHNEAEVFYILEGTAKFYLNGESTTAGPNSTFYCPPDVPHGISNAGDGTLRYLVIKNN